MKLDRITFDPNIMGGRDCIRGARMTVSNILSQLADGVSEDELLTEYPYLEREDIRQSLAYAAALARDEVLLA